MRPGDEPFLHPGRSASIVVAGADAGWFGEMHPSVAARWGLDETVAAFELDLEAIPEPPVARYVDLTSFPEIREDLAVVVAETVSAAEVLDVIRAAGKSMLARGRGVRRLPRRGAPRGGQRVARDRAHLPGADRTLTDAEVAQRRGAIIRALERDLGGRIRAA